MYYLAALAAAGAITTSIAVYKGKWLIMLLALACTAVVLMVLANQ